ncbi:transcriptional regulator family: Fungal Specific TF [Penicillium roqueforti]|nr:transcriptional regulator family: Fungal Specific TF [Penicillium roqueforti]KAI3172926.1 transcriptional regulator family: Fungal Specific TF [Penicillium roqueforti]KAI3242505.1 transcriptional regulator family: Fungal Specific TF [Penicillium roqueforti]KAI3269293.1 transcriptional regulator family: Fungal Specific TF [Penicillium roqueforti]KAI3278236.1 transcriptional regulator family: Fungal Specific TF [Penicillium roqueforti]
MPRRTHKKSRNGCVECKRRHIKCDEKGPICSNCISSERLCEYPEMTIKVMQASGRSRKRTISPSVSAESPSTKLPPDSTSSIQPDPPVNMLHAELLYHLSTETLPSLSKGENNLILLHKEVIGHALSAPYLMNELLALAALHLSIIREPQEELYRHHSAQLQNHALRMFHETDSELGMRPTVPAFIFSSMLGIHILCDTLVYRDHDFQALLDRFVHYLRIHRGVRAVIGEDWNQIKETALKPILNEAEASLRNSTRDGQACSCLLELIKAARLGPSISETYEQAIEALQSSLNAAQSDRAVDNINAVIAWPIIVSLEYTEMLVHRRPEALVILAHYAALLHSCRDLWVFGDGGSFLIQSIDRYLGPEWAEWLHWPNQVLAESTT